MWGCLQATQAENGRLWAALESRCTAQGAAAAGEAGSATEMCEQYAAMSQRMEAVLRERADVAARLSAAQVPSHDIFSPYLLILPYLQTAVKQQASSAMLGGYSMHHLVHVRSSGVMGQRCRLPSFCTGLTW
jgi:hypothetical protein